MDDAPDLVPELTDAVPAPAPKRPALSPVDALARIAAGDAVKDCTVAGLKLTGEFPGPVRFVNCTLAQLTIQKATFRGPVVFGGCSLERPRFKKAEFLDGLDLSGVTVTHGIFTDLVVRGKFAAAYGTFRHKLALLGCEFHGSASFWEVKCQGWAEFKACQFHADADFRSGHYSQGFVFENSHCHAAFVFRGTRVEKKFDAMASAFDGPVDFSKAKLQDFVYLEDIKAGPNQTWAFLNAVAERVRVRPEQVAGRLESERAGRYPDAMQEYGLLKRSYSALHRFGHEDWAFYRFKVAQRKSQPATWKRPWTVWRHAADYLFLDVGCGYGTNPLRAIRMAGAIIFGFAVLYAVNVDDLYTDKLPFPGDKTDLGNRVMIGVITSVSVFTSGMGGVRELARGWMNVPVMVEAIMGTLLFGLFIVAFSRKVIR